MRRVGITGGGVAGVGGRLTVGGGEAGVTAVGMAVVIGEPPPGADEAPADALDATEGATGSPSRLGSCTAGRGTADAQPASPTASESERAAANRIRDGRGHVRTMARRRYPAARSADAAAAPSGESNDDDPDAEHHDCGREQGIEPLDPVAR